MLKVVLAEKPSVAKSIATALGAKTRQDGYYEGNGYLVTWAVGHLVELYDAKEYIPEMKSWRMEHYPFIPEQYKYKVKPAVKKQFDIVKSLINRKDVDEVISCTDWDREGQVIADLIFINLGVKKNITRVLLNEWTPKEVKKGFENRKPNKELKNLQDAGIARQWADWVIGINLTTTTTLKYGKGKMLNVGRVIMPTLKIIYDRDMEIANFKSKDFYRLIGEFGTRSGEKYLGSYYLNNEEKFEDKKVLEQVLSNMVNKRAKVINKEVENKKEYPPYLFNLSDLQGYITSKYSGWTSDKVLKVAQELYEGKYITYPRTESKVLEESLIGKAKEVVETLKNGHPYQDEINFVVLKRNFDNSKVDSHSAITPTYMIPTSLTSDQKIVYEAIKNRFLAQFMPVAEYEETSFETIVEGLKGSFYTKGKIELNKGWKKVEGVNSKDVLIPYVESNELVKIENAELTSHKTQPPKPHTEKTLLKAMENCGKKVSEEDADSILSGFSIGTAATRAESIKKLKDVGYIQDKGKSLICTQIGKDLVETFPASDLLNLEYTGRLEKTLKDVEKGLVSKEDFLKIIYKFTTDSVNSIKNDTKTIDSIEQTSNNRGNESLGKCPDCGYDVIETSKSFGCSNWKNGCKYAIWKNDKYLAGFGKKPTKTMVKGLLKNNEVLVKGLKSSKGNQFDAILSYIKKDNGYWGWGDLKFLPKK